MTRKLDIEEAPVALEEITAREHAKVRQMESRKASLKRGRGSRLQHKGKARTAEKPWGGKRAR